MSSKIVKSTYVPSVIEATLLLSKRKGSSHPAHPMELGLSPEERLQNAEQQAAAMLKKAHDDLLLDREKAAAELEDWKRLERDQVNLELETIRQQGWSEGYDQGRQTAETDYSSKVQLAKEILAKAYKEKEEIIHEAEPFVIELSVQIASKIIQKELETKPEVLIEMIKQNLVYSNERSMISICVSPEDFSFVQAQRNQLLEMLEGQIEVKILPEHSIEKGGCVIRTSYGSIDARLDVQLKEIKQALLKTVQDEKYEETAGD
ncbi:FliH/SctL family protein [Neobacillus cucumis]|uniref:Flagellar assembly protein FliH n=1 Tax=Neobacillus cucumis TaxID=1740721 RepID=A0A2N5H7G2_9BACI|nr:FliH/SctL family protein [Neobacillus cucumis]PLS01461.1 flagellar assembly protein FliH [Neobacillus cucumis]